MPRPRSRIRYSSSQSPAQVRPALMPPAPPPLTPRPSGPRPGARAVPSVDWWTAGEMFVSPHSEERRRGFAILVGSDVARRSTLTQHLLAARADEPDLSLRVQILQALADYFEVRGREYRYPPEVRAAIADHLRRYERPQLLALLEVYLQRPSALDSLTRLLERIPNASQQLTRLAGDKAVAMELRCAAVAVIGQVGFTDAVTVLEGLAVRIEGRRAGQLTMLFAPNVHPEDVELLPVLKTTLATLKEIE